MDVLMLVDGFEWLGLCCSGYYDISYVRRFSMCIFVCCGVLGVCVKDFIYNVIEYFGIDCYLILYWYVFMVLCVCFYLLYFFILLKKYFKFMDMVIVINYVVNDF